MGKRKRPADDDDDDISPPGTPVRPYTAEDVVSPEGPFENAQKNLMSSFLSLWFFGSSSVMYIIMMT